MAEKILLYYLAGIAMAPIAICLNGILYLIIKAWVDWMIDKIIEKENRGT